MSATLEMLRYGRGQAMVGIRWLCTMTLRFHAVEQRNRVYWCGCFKQIRGVTGTSRLRRNAQRKTREQQKYRPRRRK